MLPFGISMQPATLIVPVATTPFRISHPQLHLPNQSLLLTAPKSGSSYQIKKVPRISRINGRGSNVMIFRKGSKLPLEQMHSKILLSENCKKKSQEYTLPDRSCLISSIGSTPFLQKSSPSSTIGLPSHLPPSHGLLALTFQLSLYPHQNASTDGWLISPDV